MDIPQFTPRERYIAACAAAAGAAVGMGGAFVALRRKVKAATEQIDSLSDSLQIHIDMLNDLVSDKVEDPAFTDDELRDLVKSVDPLADEANVDYTIRRMHIDANKPKLEDLVEGLGYVSNEERAGDAMYFEAGYTPEEIEAIEQINAEEDAEEEFEGVVPGNVFENQPDPSEYVNPDYTPEWDYVHEIAARAVFKDRGTPYVIHVDEYRQNENGWNQTTVTWYAGDDVVADDRDVPIDAVDTVIGLENLQTKFGHGSGNPDVVFIRNEQMKLELEVLRSTGSFSHEVLGGELKHAEPRHRSRRHFDDE